MFMILYLRKQIASVLQSDIDKINPSKSLSFLIYHNIYVIRIHHCVCRTLIYPMLFINIRLFISLIKGNAKTKVYIMRRLKKCLIQNSRNICVTIKKIASFLYHPSKGLEYCNSI